MMLAREPVTSIVVPVADASRVAEARRIGVEFAQRLRFGATDAGRVALIVTEAATNLVKHAEGGEIVLRMSDDAERAVEVLALDRGRGIRDVSASLRDGFSTAGSPGTGLGAIRRQSSTFEIYSAAGAGTAILARVIATTSPAPPSLECGAVCLMKPGEDACGDAWAIAPRPDGIAMLVADGLGHGAAAAAASAAAVTVFRRERSLGPAALLEVIHDALRPTRGAAVGVAEIDTTRGLVRFAGLGNIAGAIVRDRGVRRVVSNNGTAGHQMRKITEFTYPWDPPALFVLHSDGLGTQWDLARYPGLAARHPSLIAGVLYRDWSRRRDDVTVLVARPRRNEEAA